MSRRVEAADEPEPRSPRAARLFQLASWLSPHRALSLEEIRREFGVSERTVYRDLADLQAMKIPIVSDERGYRLMDGAKRGPVDLTPEERAMLATALEAPSLIRQPSLAERVKALRNKLSLGSEGERRGGPVLAGPEQSGPISAEVLEGINRSIQAHRTIEIQYTSLSDGTLRWRSVDPWSVFHRAGAWYLIGRCHIHDEPRMFRLDRISRLRELELFIPPAKFDLKRHLERSWTIFRSEELYPVIVHFSAKVAPLIAHARYQETETRITLPDGRIEYRVEVSHLDDLARWVLGFGAEAVVISPPALRSRVRELAEGALSSLDTGTLGRRKPPRRTGRGGRVAPGEADTAIQS